MLAIHTLSPGVSGAKTLQREPSNQVTELLILWGGGDKVALDTLVPLGYGELRRIARRYLSAERPDHTLQTAEVLAISASSVERYWMGARGWLFRELDRSAVQ